MNKAIEYKGFAIVRQDNKWVIVSYGEVLRTCKTQKECRERIDNQTV